MDAAVDVHRVAAGAADLDAGPGIGVVDAAAGDAALDDQAVSIGARAIDAEVDVVVGRADGQGRGRAVGGDRAGRLDGVDDAVVVGVGGGVGGHRGRGGLADEHAARHVAADLHRRSGLGEVGRHELGVGGRIGAAGGAAVAGGDHAAIEAERAGDAASQFDRGRARASPAHPAGDQHLAGDRSGHRDGRRVLADRPDRAADDQVADDGGVERHAEGILALDVDRARPAQVDAPGQGARPDQMHPIAVGPLGEVAVEHPVAVAVGAGVGLGVDDLAVVDEVAGVPAMQQDRGGIVLAGDLDGARVGQAVGAVQGRSDRAGDVDRRAGRDRHVVRTAIVGGRGLHLAGGRAHGGVGQGRPHGEQQQRRGGGCR